MLADPVHEQRGAGATERLLADLQQIAGRRHVLTGEAAAPYANGYRVGGGPVAAVVRPGSLVELWRVLQACVSAHHILIVQAANTGLTGGSTPQGEYDRPVVIVSTLRIGGIKPISGGRQVICLAGATLHELERVLAPLGREPHSVIGSSCIGASVVGGVCNNSGGALVQRGPAFTEYALYAQVDGDGRVHLNNHLGLEIDGQPEDLLRALDEGAYDDAAVIEDGRSASAAADYEPVVRAVDEPSPARFNADPRRLFEASGSAGKVVVFAVRLDTFPAPARSEVFYVGTNDIAELTALRRRFLSHDGPLPVFGEYIHREAFDIAATYGKDTVAAIRLFGTERLPILFRAKAWFDRVAGRLRVLPRMPSDRLLQLCSRILPQHLPARMRAFRDRYEHHLILGVADDAIATARAILGEAFPSSAGDFFLCDPREREKAMLHRFAVAGAAVRYRAVHPERIEDIVAIDVAMRRDERDWFERLPPELGTQVVAKLYYGHFFCHVFHQDYLVRKGVDPVAFEHAVLELLDARRAEYPAEHNVGHLYAAKPALAAHYRQLDPSNSLNPGIGGTSRKRNYA